MTWFRLDDQWLTHPTMQAAGLTGRALWLAGGLHCAQHLTDGRIDKHLIRVLAAQAGVKTSVATRLVELGLWADEGDHYQIPNYLEYQPSKEQVANKRAGWSRKKQLHDSPELKAAVRRRDGDQCRYCGATVRWNDRRGERGGTYDHIDPEGTNTFENLVVACRGCNSRKGARTPDQAEMPLLDLPGIYPIPTRYLPEKPRYDLATHPIPSHVDNGFTELQRCTTAPPAAAAEADQADDDPHDPPPTGPPADVIAEAARLVAQRRRTPARAATKANPAAWRAAAMTAIGAEVTEAAQSHATHVPHQPPHPRSTSPADGLTGPNAGKPAAGTIALDAEALADLIEPPRPAAPSAPTRPEDATQRAAAALATKDRTCPRCHGSGNWLDDDGLAHECDHHP